MNKMIEGVNKFILAVLAILTMAGGWPYFSPESLAALYPLDLNTLDGVAIALLQHRGMMVAVVGFLLIPSIFNKEFGKIAIPLVIFSKVTFVIRLYAFAADVGAVYFDIVAIILLLIVYALTYIWRPNQS